MSAIWIWPTALALALLLLAVATPRHWWRRPTLGNLALAGSLTCGSALLLGVGTTAPPVQAMAVPSNAPAAVSSLHVREALNLRSAPQVEAPRLATLPAGTEVRLSGVRQGDWRQVQAELNGHKLSGWSNSLWLRRTEEQKPPR